jgi:hypothetical protein
MKSNIKPDYNFSNYTELSKYYELALDDLKSIFETRCLDWKYYYNKAKKESIEIGHPITITDVLTENLIEYDRAIKSFYKIRKLLFISNTKIFKEFSKKDNYLKFK